MTIITMFEEEIRRYDKTVADYQELIVAPMGKEQYRERNEVLFSCHSCGIEGNSFTVDNTRELFEQGLGSRLRIRESLEDTLTIQDLAQELGVSYSSFRKLFKEYTGFAPALYQQTLKLQRAKELLSTTNESIKEIAYRLNFESPDYFSAKFKNQTGMKPSDFRNTTR